MNFQVFYEFNSSLIPLILIGCPEKIFQKLLSLISIYIIILENIFQIIQMYDKLVKMLLSYLLVCYKRTFSNFAFQYN